MAYGAGAYDNYPLIPAYVKPPWEPEEPEGEPPFDDRIEPWEIREDDQGRTWS